MYKNKKILSIITARGGSKSIPKKNIKPILGKPLIAYTIEAANQSQLLTRTILSSDNDEIITISKKYGADVPFVRPAEYAQDHSTSIEVVQHAVKWLQQNQNQTFDYIMILQPTSPLRSSNDIDESIKVIVDNDADSVMGMKKLIDFSLKKLKKIENNIILPLLENEGKTSSRRQDIEQKIYKRNCAIYLTKTELIMKGDLFGQKSLPYLMPEERSVDINSLQDLAIAEWHLKYNQSK